jgi:ATP synthase protein I
MANEIPKSCFEPISWSEEEANEVFPALSAQEAQKWRKLNPQMGIWSLVVAQLTIGLFLVALALVCEFFAGQKGLTVSCLYGALVVILPGAVCVRGIISKFGQGNIGLSVAKFFVWESAKIAMSVVMLMLAPRWLGEDLSWPGLLMGLILTFKGFWVLVVWRHLRTPRPHKSM